MKTVDKMKLMHTKGQAEIMDGLILMLITAVCSVVLLSISGNYGSLPVQIYEETYAQKLAQNTLLSLYHITDQDPNSQFYKKSVMVAVSNSLAKGDITLKTPADITPRSTISGLLEGYYAELGWHFMFAILPDGVMIDSSSIIASDPDITTLDKFKENVGSPYCASAALTYPKPTSGDCADADIGKDAGSMCYTIFELCVWQT